jgi:ParB-like chromosome segregation protein Spo0J
VHNLLRITALPAAMQDEVRSGSLTEKHCRALARLRDDPQAQAELWHRIHAEEMSGDTAVAEATRWLASRRRPIAPGHGAERSASAAEAETPQPRIAVVAEALMEALDSAADAELELAHDQLATLQRRLGALLAGAARRVVPAAVAPLGPADDDGGIEERRRPVLLPVAGGQAG